MVGARERTPNADYGERAPQSANGLPVLDVPIRHAERAEERSAELGEGKAHHHG
jgi:hypothetical protein